MNEMRKQLGVTLMELVVTVAVIGILAAIGTPVLLSNITAAKNVDAQNTLKSIFLMEKNFFADKNCYYVSTGPTARIDINQNLFGATSNNNDSPIAPPGKNDFAYEVKAMSGTAACPQSYEATAKISGTTYTITELFVKTKVVTDGGNAITSSW